MTAFLAEIARPSPLAFNQGETRRFISVLAERMERNKDCCKEIFFGIFFDGTNNNRDRDLISSCHSNVARLYDVFPQKQQADGMFPIYAQGVGTTFKEIDDTGEGDDLVWGNTDRRRGLAFAEKGEVRIVWALLTMLNSLHVYFAKSALLSPDKIKKIANDLTEANVPLWAKLLSPAASAVVQWTHKRQLIDARRNQVLGELCREVEKVIKTAQRERPKPRVLGIRLSVFGFSRGAAEARVFSNWFVDMCRAASGGASLGGLTIDFDFLGIFDTVASVCLANSSLIADGHMEWADAERNMRIPPEVKRCVHLVSAHEVRRSFPLDSIGVGQGIDGRYMEVVYPGVHSDVGGGYKPREQGRGTDAKGDDMLSRVALAEMYREARLANVPLDVDGKGVTSSAKAALAVSDTTRDAFNAYIAECKVKSGKLADILDEQTRLYVRWRRLRLESMANLASVQRADTQDRTDLLEANRELAEEAKLLSAPIAAGDISAFNFPAVTLIKLGKKVVDGIDKRGIDVHHYAEWQRLKNDWNAPGHLPSGVSRLFENWIHDSRAWFKPLGDDDHIWERRQRERIKRLEQQKKDWEKFEQSNQALPKLVLAQRGLPPGAGYCRPLTETEQRELDAWKRNGQLPAQPVGREPFATGGGYLRYRRVYYGSDANIVAMVVPLELSIA